MFILFVLLLLLTTWGVHAAINCNGGIDQFCPSAAAPVVGFAPTGGTAVGQTAGCCKGSYLQCQVQENIQFRRTILEYVIPASSPPTTTSNTNATVAAAVEVCPIPDNPDCNCQEALRAEVTLNLNFCPSRPTCCPECLCTGDPHCQSFTRELDTFAVCDNRDETCVHRNETCGEISWDNQPCEWRAGKCERAPRTSVPQMEMYSKQYRSYFDPQDNRQHEFKLTLMLSTYGAIGAVVITDFGVQLNFTIGSRVCNVPEQYTLRNGKVTIDNLPSGVIVELTCVFPHTRNRRWDVTGLVDPWFVPEHASEEQFGGFCAAGTIIEATASPTLVNCTVLDRQVSRYFKCSVNRNVADCKTDFCEQNAAEFQWQSVDNLRRSQQRCEAFVNGADTPNNFLVAACTLSKLHPRNPTKCLADSICKQCVDDILDFPDEMTHILNKRVPKPIAEIAQRDSCQGDLLQTGLAREALLPSFSGVEIQYRRLNSNGDWTPIFALLDSEITQCGGCGNTLFVNGNATNAQILVNPGQYRIVQGVGLDTDPTQDVCGSAPGYNSTVTYSNPFIDGEAIGIPLGLLWSDGDLVCNPATYPNCPPAYQCCVWPRPAEQAAWENCMAQYSGRFPSC